MGKYDIEDKSYCGFDCDNKKCTRNVDNCKNPEMAQFSYYEDCDEYTVKKGKDENGKDYIPQDLTAINIKSKRGK